MNLTVNIPDDDIPALKAHARSLPLETFVEQVVRERIQGSDSPASEASPSAPLRTAADIVLKHMRNVPPEIMATMPKDGASQHDHYIYGLPKRDV